MKKLQVLGSVAMACALVVGCGGGDESYSNLVVFGDSLSDVGSYRTPGIAQTGGGEYTVNGTGKVNWTELLARELALPAPCAAQTGLESSGPLGGLAAPTVDHSGCFSYAQGGSRVTDPVGPWNKGLLAFSDPSGYLGQLTDPLVNQIKRHLGASPGKHFAENELVAVLAGGNDIFMQAGILKATVAAGGDPATAAAAAIAGMATAGDELAGYIKTQVVNKGAQHVVVVTLPDIGKTPDSLVQSADTQALITQMVQAFNTHLSTPLAGMTRVLLVDAFSASQDQAAHPDHYGLTNVTTPACDFSKMAFPSSLVCSTPGTVVAGDISHFQYADTVHQTPYGYRLLAEFVAAEMTKHGWLEVVGKRPCQHTKSGCALNGRPA